MMNKKLQITQNFWVKSSIVALCILLLDQATKHLVRQNIGPHESIGIIGLFRLTYVTNTGVSFGLFKGNNLFFIVVSLLALGFVLYEANKEKQFWFSWGLIVAGILGNLIDRLWLGAVIDFIDLTYWPIFNVADSAISLGVVSVIYLSWRTRSR